MTSPELIDSANILETEYGPILFDGLTLANLAHVRVLHDANVIGDTIQQELLHAILDVASFHDRVFEPEIGDAYMCYEDAIAGRAPLSVGWLRAGRARRDATNVAFYLTIRSMLLELILSTCDLARTLHELASKHADTLMLDYTYWQPAQPTTLGHYLLGALYPLIRNMLKVRTAFMSANKCPGGIGSVNGSRLGTSRTQLSQLLGFATPVVHTRDAMWQADLPIEIASALVQLLTTLSRLAEDLQIWYMEEVATIDLDEEICRPSVIMPHKKNPYALAYIRGLANTSLGDMVAMAAVGHTATGQPDSRIFCYGTIPRMIADTRKAVRLMDRVLKGVNINVCRMRELAEIECAKSTDRREVEMLDRGRHLMDAKSIINTRTALGGAAPEPMELMLKLCKGKIIGNTDWAMDVICQIRQSENALRRECYELSRPA